MHIYIWGNIAMPYNPRLFVGRYRSHFEANCVTIVYSSVGLQDAKRPYLRTCSTNDCSIVNEPGIES